MVYSKFASKNHSKIDFSKVFPTDFQTSTLQFNYIHSNDNRWHCSRSTVGSKLRHLLSFLRFYLVRGYRTEAHPTPNSISGTLGRRNVLSYSSASPSEQPFSLNAHCDMPYLLSTSLYENISPDLIFLRCSCINIIRTNMHRESWVYSMYVCEYVRVSSVNDHIHDATRDEYKIISIHWCRNTPITRRNDEGFHNKTETKHYHYPILWLDISFRFYFV